MTLVAQLPGEMQAPAAVDDFVVRLHREFKPRSDQSREAVENAVMTLADQALRHASLISDDAVETIESIIASIDEKLSEQINEILHHPDFQALESAWRGLHHLTFNTETDETLKIRVLSISKKEMSRTLRKFKGIAWDQSPPLQEDLRRGIWAGWGRALWLLGCGLLLRPQPS